MFNSIAEHRIPTDLVQADITLNLNEFAEKLLDNGLGWGGWLLGISVVGGVLGKYVVAPMISKMMSHDDFE